MATATRASQLVEALARHLDTAGLVRYSTAGALLTIEDPARPAVAFEALPPAPDSAVSIAVVNQLEDRDPYNPDVYVRLRFRTAGLDVRPVNDIADRVFQHLVTFEPTGPRQVWPDGVNVLTVFRTVRAASAADVNGRWMRADTYRITLNPGDE